MIIKLTFYPIFDIYKIDLSDLNKNFVILLFCQTIDKILIINMNDYLIIPVSDHALKERGGLVVIKR